MLQSYSRSQGPLFKGSHCLVLMKTPPGAELKHLISLIRQCNDKGRWLHDLNNGGALSNRVNWFRGSKSLFLKLAWQCFERFFSSLWRKANSRPSVIHLYNEINFLSRIKLNLAIEDHLCNYLISCKYIIILLC